MVCRLGLLQRFEAQLGWETMLNRKSTSWRQLTPEQQNNLDRDKALHLLQENPTLIKRPIADDGSKLLIGFSPELYRQKL